MTTDDQIEFTVKMPVAEIVNQPSGDLLWAKYAEMPMRAAWEERRRNDPQAAAERLQRALQGHAMSTMVKLDGNGFVCWATGSPHDTNRLSDLLEKGTGEP